MPQEMQGGSKQEKYVADIGLLEADEGTYQSETFCKTPYKQTRAVIYFSSAEQIFKFTFQSCPGLSARCPG